MSRMIGKLLDQVATVIDSLLEQDGDTAQACNSRQPGKDIMMKEGSTTEMQFTETDDGADNVAPGVDPVGADTAAGVQNPEMETGMGKATIAEFRASADEFMAAFNVALYEIESSRKKIEERSIRIDELNESIETINCSLHDAVNDGRRKEEEHSREKEQLNQRIRDAESERDRLCQELHAQETTLNARAEEIGQLSSRVNELGDALEQSTVEGRRAQEEYACERDALTGKLDELQELFEEADSQMKLQQKALAEGDEEISRLNCRVDELIEEISAQSESMRLQSESHANVIEELDARIISVTGEMEELQSAYEESRAHVEKLENLNRALHESAISENTLHKRALANKQNAIDSYRSKLEAANALLEGRADNATTAENLETALSDLESRLKEAETLNQALRERAKVTEELEAETGQLRAALQEAMDSSAQNATHTQGLQQSMLDLQSELESAQSMQESLVARLGDYESLKEEVMSLRTAAQQASNDSSALVDAGTTLEQLRSEVDELKSALSDSEEQRAQLQSALYSAYLPDELGSGSVPSPAHNTQSVPVIADRNRFVSHLDNLLAEREDSDVKQTVMYVLLDNFIRVRDEIGIMNSEDVIDDILGIISSVCDANDIISRFDDHDFAILSSDESIDKAREKAETICSVIKHHGFNYAGKSLSTTASIGICSIRRNDTSAETVMSRAEHTCDAARLSGGNGVLANSAIAGDLVTQGDNAKHEDMVDRTLSEKRIRMYYQPISCLMNYSGSNFEVLIRVVDETGNIILPGEFFSMAASTRREEDIDRYVIDSIMQTLSENPDLKTKMFIKLTGQSVANKELPAWIVGKIKEYWINPEQLVFEIAESILQKDIRNVSTLSRELNAIGCMIAIEHYQMSTHPHRLKHIHADFIKIDAKLTGSLSRNSNSQSKVAAIMDVAREYNYITIAEGVENPACLNKLWEMGVNCVQGHFVKQPSVNLNFDFRGITPGQHSKEDSKASFTIE